jgi:hypothetical protein
VEGVEPLHRVRPERELVRGLQRAHRLIAAPP